MGDKNASSILESQVVHLSSSCHMGKQGNVKSVSPPTFIVYNYSMLKC